MKMISKILVIVTLCAILSCKKDSTTKRDYMITIAVELQTFDTINVWGDSVWHYLNDYHYGIPSTEHESHEVPEYPLKFSVDRINNLTFKIIVTDQKETCSFDTVTILNEIERPTKWSNYKKDSCGRTKVGVAISRIVK